MINTIYYIITFYFIVGAVGFFFINRKKPIEIARKSWTKYITYYIIINVFFFSITINSLLFKILCLGIYIIAMYEMYMVYKQQNRKNKTFFFTSISILVISAVAFYIFSSNHYHYILYVFILLSIFDSFSQISGQIFGGPKVIPHISPKKTYSGMVGGTIIVIISAIIMSPLYPSSYLFQIQIGLGISISAFIGDIAASYFKRKYKVKDYSKLIPGHGGILDRFDSLIGVGSILGLIQIFN